MDYYGLSYTMYNSAVDDQWAQEIWTKSKIVGPRASIVLYS